MKSITFSCLAALCLFAVHASAITIVVDPGPPGTTSFDTRINFSQINGMTLSGQHLLLDFIFPAADFIRLGYGGGLSFSLIFQTNAGTSPGSFSAKSSYLLDSSGNQFGGLQSTGSGSGSDGSLNVGSFPQLSLMSGGVFGLHFDLTFPTTGFQITDAQFRILATTAPFIVGAPIPEGSATLVLLSLGMTALFIARRKGARSLLVVADQPPRHPAMHFRRHPIHLCQK